MAVSRRVYCTVLLYCEFFLLSALPHFSRHSSALGCPLTYFGHAPGMGSSRILVLGSGAARSAGGDLVPRELSAEYLRAYHLLI